MAETNGQSITLAGQQGSAIDLRTDRAAFEPQNLEQALALAGKMVGSGLMPRAMAKPESVLVAIMMGRELGLSAMQAVRSIHVIEGKPSMSADLIIGLVKKSVFCKYFQLVESTNQIATYRTLRASESEPTEMSFTIEDAKAAGLTGKDNWRKYPAAMLRARAGTALARAVYPDLAMGLYDPDEIEREPERDITPATPTTPSTAKPPRRTHAPAVSSEQPKTITVPTDSSASEETPNDAQEPSDAAEPPHDAQTGEVAGDAPDEAAMISHALQSATTREEFDAAVQLISPQAKGRLGFPKVRELNKLVVELGKKFSGRA